MTWCPTGGYRASYHSTSRRYHSLLSYAVWPSVVRVSAVSRRKCVVQQSNFPFTRKSIPSARASRSIANTLIRQDDALHACRPCTSYGFPRRSDDVTLPVSITARTFWYLLCSAWTVVARALQLGTTWKHFLRYDCRCCRCRVRNVSPYRNHMVRSFVKKSNNNNNNNNDEYRAGRYFRGGRRTQFVSFLFHLLFV